MIVLSNSIVQVVPVGEIISFDSTLLHTGCRHDGHGGAEYHDENSSDVKLRKPGIYEISFSANVTSTETGAEIQFSILVNGSPIEASTIVQTISKKNSFENIAKTVPVRIDNENGAAVTIANTSTTETAIVDSNPSLYIRRIA